MYIVAETLDDALLELYPALLASQNLNTATQGATRELIGVSIDISRPRARLSRTETRGKSFSCLGELLWYLTGDNNLDFIRYYIPRYNDFSEDGMTVYGGYGPRLFNNRGIDQIANVIELLGRNPTSRRALIQIFNAEDLAEPHKEIPCTSTLQYLLRNGLLHAVTTMRSNDAFIGLPHDVFCFTMIQEIVARSLGAEVGAYKHFVGSMHLYERDAAEAEQYLSEKVQARVEMPPMPIGDPWPSIIRVLEAEERLREEEFDADTCGVPPYWADIIRLIQVLEASGDEARIAQLKSKMAFPRYANYIEARKEAKPRKPHEPTQPKLRLRRRPAE